MQTRVKFQCPECEVRLSARGDRSGHEIACPRCESPVVVPMSRALVPIRREAVIAEVIDDAPPPRKLARRPRRNSTPVELRLPGQLGGMKAEVDRKTSNMMATTFLGGLLVAVGAVLFAMFGGKSRA
jgi:DNA-directed RNA polymerase subunit RPC12/RpoP